MLSAAQIKEVNGRFAQVTAAHLKRWESANPLPKLPSVPVMVRDLRNGDFKVFPKELKRLRVYRRYNETDFADPQFTEVIETKSFAEFKVKLQTWEEDKKQFEEVLTGVKNAYLDRVLFDHESAFVMLSDFQRWKHSPEEESQ